MIYIKLEWLYFVFEVQLCEDGFYAGQLKKTNACRYV